MIEFQRRRKIRSIIYSKWILLLAIIALVFFARSTFTLWQKERDTKKTVDTLKNELETLAAKEKNLSSRVASLKTERGVEEAIRDKFKVVKEGEGVIVVVDQNKPSDNITASVSGLQAIFDRFFDIFR